ncbi:hypothetical protein ACFQ0M_34730 [Kitasatospora aburaviensis]
MVMCFLLATALLGPWVARAAAGLLGAPLRLGAGASGSLAADNSRANARRLASAITPIVMVTAFCGTLLFLQTTIGHVTGEQLRNGITADHVVGSAGLACRPAPPSRPPRCPAWTPPSACCAPAPSTAAATRSPPPTPSASTATRPSCPG